MSSIAPILSTPNSYDEVQHKDQTPSPQAVHEFSSGRSDVVSDGLDVGLPSLADATLADSAPSQHANVIVGPERRVTFHTDSLGIKLSRHSDGLVMVLSI